MPNLIFIAVTFLVILSLMLAIGLGVGWLLHFLLPIDLGFGFVIGMIGVTAALHLMTQMFSALTTAIGAAKAERSDDEKGKMEEKAAEVVLEERKPLPVFALTPNPQRRRNVRRR